MKRRHWVFILLIVVLAALWIFRSEIIFRIAPKMVLSRAMDHTWEALEDRFADSPLRYVAGAINPEGCQNVSLQLEQSHELLGYLRCDMGLQFQNVPRRILGEGKLCASGRVLDFSVYMDEQFAAVCAPGLSGGIYYGITYDTFSEDIRKQQMLSFLLGGEMTARLESMVEDLQESISQPVLLPVMQPQDIRMALYGLLLLKTEAGYSEMETSAGKQMIPTVRSRATGEQLAEIAEPYLSRASEAQRKLVDALIQDPASEMECIFYLQNDHVMQLEGEWVLSGCRYRLKVELGEDPERDAISVILISGAGESETVYSVTVDTAADEQQYCETIMFRTSKLAAVTAVQAEYTWDLSSGDLRLKIIRDQEEQALRLNLTGSEGSMTIRTQDWTALWETLTGETSSGTAICTLTIQPGLPVRVPKYRNLDQWSGEDLMALLGSFGGLIGVPMQ